MHRHNNDMMISQRKAQRGTYALRFQARQFHRDDVPYGAERRLRGGEEVCDCTRAIVIHDAIVHIRTEIAARIGWVAERGAAKKQKGHGDGGGRRGGERDHHKMIKPINCEQKRAHRQPDQFDR